MFAYLLPLLTVSDGLKCYQCHKPGKSETCTTLQIVKCQPNEVCILERTDLGKNWNYFIRLAYTALFLPGCAEPFPGCKYCKEDLCNNHAKENSKTVFVKEKEKKAPLIDERIVFPNETKATPVEVRPFKLTPHSWPPFRISYNNGQLYRPKIIEFKRHSENCVH